MQGIKKIKENIVYIFKNGIKLALTFLSIVGTYFSLFNPNIKTNTRVLILVGCVILAYFFYFVWIVICRKVTVYEQDSKKICVKYGDIIEQIDQCEKTSSKAIFVIPVNRCFDTIVDDVIIENRSVHGQVVNYCEQNIYKRMELDKKIQDSLKGIDFESLSDKEKDKGNKKRYPVGTIAKVESIKGNIFYFLALPKFKKVDDKITVDTSINMHDYLICLQKMVDYYNTDGRNLPVYMPTIGCGLSRLHISIDDSVKQLICIWRLNHDVIRDSVNIIVHKKNFFNTSILKYKKEGE